MIKPLAKIIFFLVLCLSCKNLNVDKSQQILFYVRMEGGNNGQFFFNDYIAITNYSTKPKTVGELYNIALRYVDTAKARLEVNSVTILAKDISHKAREWNFEIFDENKKYFLIEFEFNHFVKSYMNDPRKLFAITFWKDGEAREYDIRDEQLFIDSILKSPAPLVNKPSK